jgi:hypothetical protein
LDKPLELKQNDLNEWDIRNNENLYWPSPNPILFFVNYVNNNITSDAYRYENQHYHVGEQNCIYKEKNAKIDQKVQEKIQALIQEVKNKSENPYEHEDNQAEKTT